MVDVPRAHGLAVWLRLRSQHGAKKGERAFPGYSRSDSRDFGIPNELTPVDRHRIQFTNTCSEVNDMVDVPRAHGLAVWLWFRSRVRRSFRG